MEKEQDINFSHFKGNLTRKPILKGNEKKYYWYLTPYNKSIFMTAVENGIEMVFFAIKENEELYS